MGKGQGDQLMRLEKKAPPAQGNHSDDMLNYNNVCANFEQDWLTKTVKMCLDQGYTAIPKKKSATYKYGEYYALDEFIKCKQKIFGIRLDNLVLVDYDGNKPDKPCIPHNKLMDILGEPEPYLVQSNDLGDSLHYLYRLPDVIDRTTLKHSNDGWLDGVDLKTGNQLMHLQEHKLIINGQLPTFDQLPHAPQILIDALTTINIRNVKQAKDYIQTSDQKAAKLLSYIPANCDYSTWIKIGMALHDEFKGNEQGLELWDQWSITGVTKEVYAGRTIIEYKWQTFGNYQGAQVTFATIVELAKKAGADIAEINAKYDFNGKLKPTFEQVTMQIDSLSDGFTPQNVQDALKAISYLAPIEQAQCLNKVQTYTKLGKRELTKELNAITQRTQPKIDMGICYPDFVESATGEHKPTFTIANVKELLNYHSIAVYYDVIKKKTVINAPMIKCSLENYDNSALAHVYSLANQSMLPSKNMQNLNSFIDAIASENPKNMVIDWIRSVNWDQQDRIKPLCNTLVLATGYPEHMRDTLVTKWLISAIAAAFKPTGFKSRGVLTLQGPQSIGKTSWLDSLVPDNKLRSELIKTGHLLDPSNKDSVLTALSHWLVELGELETTFNKSDIGKLKAFITESNDKVRRVYGYKDSEYPRRTVFFASVNETTFLMDQTGNTRFWTIPVSAINYKHEIDMVQLWAQVYELYKTGSKWWLDNEQELQLEHLNQGHSVVSSMEELILTHFDFDSDERLKRMTATEVAMHCGYKQPTTKNSRDAGQSLRKLIGSPTRVKGKATWKMPPFTYMELGF